MRNRAAASFALICVATVLFVWFPPASSSAQSVHSGSFAARITNRSPSGCIDGDTGLDRFRKTFRGVSGHRLKVSWWMRSAGDTPCIIRKISMSCYADARSSRWTGNDTHWLIGHKAGSKWEFHEVEYKVPEANPWLNFQFRVEPGHSLVVDDVSIKDMDTDGIEMLTNGGFEDWPESMRHMPPAGWRFFAAGCSVGSVERMLGKAPVLTWQTSLAEARDMSGKTGKALLILFHSPEANASKHYETVFADPEVALLLRDTFVLLRLDLLKHTEIAAQMKVFRAGTIYVYHSSGKGLLRVDDQPTASELLSRLKALKL